MADSIKGITLKIDGDNKGLVKSLEDARKSVNLVWNSLKNVNQALKLDPKNVDALNQKYNLLNRAIDETTKRLEVEKKVAEEAAQALSAGTIDQGQYDLLQSQVAKTTASIENLKEQAKETKDALDGIGNADVTPEDTTAANTSISALHDKTELLVKGLEVVQKVGDAAGATLAKGFDMAAQAAGLAVDAVQKVGEVSTQVVEKVGQLSYNLSSQVVHAYGEYEQLEGGVEKLFGNAANAVIRNSARAYRTAGLDANNYLQTVTSFSASLIQGLDGDVQRAAELSDQALTDMADNANTFGTSIEAIQSAYQGFAKGNYNMLDNLRLGYGGTKTEMIRLINDSGILNERISSLDNISFGQMIEAIHAVQDQMNITGTTANEAERTIEGSINMLKAAYQNLIIGLGQDGADVTALTNNVAEAFNTVVNNVKPVLSRMADNLPGILPSMIEQVRGGIPDAVRVVGEVMNAVGSAIAEAAPDVLDVAIENLPQAADIISTLLRNLSSALQQNSPAIIEAFGSVLPAFTEVGADILSIIVQTIIDNAPQAVNTLMDAISPQLDQIFGEGTADKVREALNTLVERGPEIIENVVGPLVRLTGTLAEHLPEIVDAAIPVIEFAAEHLPEIVTLLIGLQASGALAGIASSAISIAGSIAMLSGGTGLTAISGLGTAFTTIGTAASGALSSIGTFAATNAGPLAALVGEVIALKVEWDTFNELMDEAESLGISKTEAIAGGFQEIRNQIAGVPEALEDTFSSFDNFYENIVGGALSTADDVINTFGEGGSHMAENWALSCNDMAESTQTIEQQAMQVSTDIQLAIEQSGASATQSVADDCAVIQSYLDNLEANGQVELRARVITEYQTIITQGAIADGERSRADYYSTQGRRRINQENWANSIHAQGQRDMAERYAQQGQAALRAVEETAQTAQRAISSYGGGGGSSGGGGGGGGSSRNDDEDKTSALTASKAEELLTSINDKFDKLLEKFGISTKPDEYQTNVNQMIDGLLKALETNYTDASIEAAKAEIQRTMSSFGLGGDITAETLEQLRTLVNSQPAQNTEAFNQVQTSVAAIQQATVDYTPHFNTITSVLGQLLALKQSEENTFNIYVGNELLDTYIQQSLVNQSLVSGGV